MISALVVHQEQTVPLTLQAEQATYRTGKTLIGGMALGYAIYWFTRFLVKLEYLIEVEKGIVQPLPYVLGGFICAGLSESARLAYEASLAILGDRSQYEHMDLTSKATASDRLRKHSWKIVSHAESVPKQVDMLYSRLFKIRTYETIYNQKIPDNDLRMTEIARRAFIEQVHETLTTSVPQIISIKIVEACGYTLLGAPTLVNFLGIIFLVGTLQKILDVYQELMNRELAKKKKGNSTTSPPAEPQAAP